MTSTTRLMIAAAVLLMAGPGPALCGEDVFTATGSFRVGIPAVYGFNAYLDEPIPNVEFTDNIPPLAKVVLRVERYSKGNPWNMDQARFVRELLEGVKKPKIEARKVSGKQANVYSNIGMTRVRHGGGGGRDYDPYGRALGAEERPWLGLFDWRPFPIGGDAYRLYRCRKLGIYESLRYYSKIRTDPKETEQLKGWSQIFLDEGPGFRWPQKLRACGGGHLLERMRAGQSIEGLMPKEPTMAELRAMAKEEYGDKDEVLADLMAVAVVPYSDGFFAIRYRAPAGDYKANYRVFEGLLSSFQLLKP